MNLDRANVRAGFPGLSSAREWNQFAARVNALWNTRAGPGLKLTKGEPWLLQYAASAPVLSNWFNDAAYRVFVWRDDLWDYGSDNPPLAFFVTGAFTTLNDLPAQYFAKVVKGADGKSARAAAFCDQVDFTGPTLFMSKNKNNAAKLFVGSQGLTQYHADYTGNAHLLDWQSGAQDTSFAGANCTFPSSPMVGMASVAGGFLANDYTGLYATNANGGNVVVRTSGYNMHSILNDGVHGYVTMRATVPYSGNEYPSGLRKIDNRGVQVPAFDAYADTGSGAACFFGTLPNLALWDAGDRTIYASASLEYETSSAMTWRGNAFGFPGYTAGILGVASDGLGAGTALGIQHIGPDGGWEPSNRATVFCKSPAGDIWFGTAVLELRTSTQVIPTEPFQLYRYNPNTDTAAYFTGFNDAVYDCQWFSTVGDLQQFIVLGAFTEYLGQPAERIVFIDQNGNRLDDLIWP